MFLGASNKGPEEQGKGFVSKFECWGCGAAEAAAGLSRTQKKQHVGSIMGPPIRSKGYYYYFFSHYFGYFITQPFQAERLRSPVGKGMEDLGKTGMTEQRSVDQ